MTATDAVWQEAQLLDVVQPGAPIGYGIVQPGPYVRDGIPVIAIRDLPRPSLQGIHRSARAIEAAYGRSRIADGDVLISVKGTTGRVGIVPAGFSGNISRDVVRLRLRDEHEPAYWFQMLQSPQAQRTLQQAAVGSTRQELSIGTLKLLSFHFPNLPEQKRIASVLTDADQLIAALERMIAKKQALKQGMMQQLLTGKTCLPGFTGPWSNTTLGMLGTFLKGRGVKRDDVRSTGIRCVRYGELYTAFHDYTAEAKSFVSPDVATTALPLKTGDLLFAGSGETREEIGKCIAYIGPTPVVAGGDVIVLRGDQFNSIYLALLMNTPAVVSQKARAGQGDAVVHIYSHALAAVELNLPPHAEQNAIAQVILGVDQEIGLFKKRLRKALSVKQGMLQELLTGRTRLPVGEGAA